MLNVSESWEYNRVSIGSRGVTHSTLFVIVPDVIDLLFMLLHHLQRGISSLLSNTERTDLYTVPQYKFDPISLIKMPIFWVVYSLAVKCCIDLCYSMVQNGEFDEQINRADLASNVFFSAFEVFTLVLSIGLE